MLTTKQKRNIRPDILTINGNPIWTLLHRGMYYFEKFSKQENLDLNIAIKYYEDWYRGLHFEEEYCECTRTFGEHIIAVGYPSKENHLFRTSPFLWSYMLHEEVNKKLGTFCNWSITELCDWCNDRKGGNKKVQLMDFNHLITGVEDAVEYNLIYINGDDYQEEDDLYSYEKEEEELYNESNNIGILEEPKEDKYDASLLLKYYRELNEVKEEEEEIKEVEKEDDNAYYLDMPSNLFKDRSMLKAIYTRDQENK